VELTTLEFGGFKDGFNGGFGIISLSSLLGNSCQFLVLWQELAIISSILQLTSLAK